MNQLPAYEQWIAENIEGIEVPDMADAIWNRIEAVLDVEMPANNNPQQAPSKGNSFFNNPVALIISAGIIAIIITLFILYRHNKVQQPPTPLPVPQQQLLPAPQPEISPQKDSSKHDTGHTEQSKQSSIEDYIKRPIDTTRYTPLLDTRDSIAKLNKDSLRVPTIKPSIGIMQPRKYGVQAHDSDYRMTTERKE